MFIAFLHTFQEQIQEGEIIGTVIK